MNFLKWFIVITLLLSTACSTIDPNTNETNRFQFKADVFSDDTKVISVMNNFSDQYYQLKAEDRLELVYHFTNPISGDYLLEPGDRIAISFIKTPELNLDQKIRPDGKLSLQYIGDVAAAGKSVEQLTATIKQAYQAILKAPTVLVVVKEAQNKMASLKESLRHYNTGYSRFITIKSDGLVSLPLIGEVDIKDQSIAQIKQQINKQYQQKYPSIAVDLLVEKSASRRIYVLGQVNKPGAFTVTRPTSIIEAIALAGGTNQRSNIKSAIAMRRVNNQVIAKVLDIEKIMEGKENLSYLLPEDTLYISQTRLSKAADIAKQFSDVIFFRGWGLNAAYRIDDEDLK